MKLAGLSCRQEAVNMLPSKVCTTVNEEGEEGLVCWEGKEKKKVTGGGEGY